MLVSIKPHGLKIETETDVDPWLDKVPHGLEVVFRKCGQKQELRNSKKRWRIYLREWHSCRVGSDGNIDCSKTGLESNWHDFCDDEWVNIANIGMAILMAISVPKDQIDPTGIMLMLFAGSEVGYGYSYIGP